MVEKVMTEKKYGSNAERQAAYRQRVAAERKLLKEMLKKKEQPETKVIATKYKPLKL